MHYYLDAVVGSKSGDREQGVQERILSTLLIEMDGIGLKVNMQKDTSLSFLANECCEVEKTYSKDQSDGVIIIGATNHPELLDPALKRPGRFDKLIYIPPPNKMERLQILEKLTEKMPLHESVNLKYLAELTEFYSGADLKNLCQECGLYVLNCTNMSANCIHQFHFEQVISKFKPSLNKELIKFYESFEMSNE